MSINAKKYLIELSQRQLQGILKAVYLGDWMANACRISEIQTEYKEAVQLVFSLAAQFGLEEYVERSEEGSDYYPSREFEDNTGVDELKREYDDAIFWEELAHRLGEREFHKKYSQGEIKKMNRNERFTLLYRHIDAFSEELEKFGLERIGVIA